MADITTALTTAITECAKSCTSVIGSILPLALPIVGGMVVVTLGLKVFKKVTGKA